MRCVSIKFFGFLTLLLFDAGCGPKTYYPNEEKGDGTATGTLVDGCAKAADTVTYTGAAREVINTYCTSCHSAKGGQQPMLSTFAESRAGFAAGGYMRVQQNTMPPSPLNITNRCILMNWKAGGYAE